MSCEGPARQPDPEERLHDEADGDTDKDEKNSDKRGDRHDVPDGEREQLLSEGLPWLAVVLALEDQPSP